MRKSILLAVFAAALLCLSQIMSAVPAKPGKITITQPDGSTITVRIHGDEWFHYITDENGNILEENESGYLVKSTHTFEDIKANMAIAQAAKSQILSERDATIMKVKTNGSPKIPVFLVQFKDKSFTISSPKTAFTNLLTQDGYSANGGTGSVVDYYRDQSRGAFTPQFVVMDVVTLSNNLSSYGTNGALTALYEAFDQLNSSVDFSQFDNDGDGKIDMALMYYAGYNPAEGGPQTAIWPHQSSFTGGKYYDGVQVNRYFCTSELRGSSGTKMCGIGTTCHEFAHSLGLPDFYDTNYDDYDEEAGGTYYYDVMCSGSYNNNGCTPPWMNAEELVMLGWMNGITELTNTGYVNIPSIGAEQPRAFKSSTSAEGEYFLYECRPGTDWDAPLKAGLLVYHVDKARSHNITWNIDNTRTNTQTAYNLWANWASYNAINCNGSHPCFYIVPAGDQTNLNYFYNNFTFPGSTNISTYTPIDWSGHDTGFSLSQISFNSSTKDVTFRLTNSNDCSVSGFVMNSDGVGIEGATVTLRAGTSSSNSIRKGNPTDLEANIAVLRSPADAPILAVVTDATGSYYIPVDAPGTYVIEASKDGYVSKSSTVNISRLMTQNFYLLREGEEEPSEIYTYPDDGDLLGIGNPDATSWDLMVSDNFPASIMGAYAGKQIKAVSFIIDGETDGNGVRTTTGKVYGIVDLGGENKAYVEVEDPIIGTWNTVDVSDFELLIPEGQEIYAGFAVEEWTYAYPIVGKHSVDPSLIGYTADLALDSNNWQWNALPSYVFTIKLTIGDYVPQDTGYNFIKDPNNGIYPLGSKFALNLIQTESERRPNAAGITWFYDNEPVSGSSITLSKAGNHTVKAEFTTENGTKKVIEHQIEVGDSISPIIIDKNAVKMTK